MISLAFLACLRININPLSVRSSPQKRLSFSAIARPHPTTTDTAVLILINIYHLLLRCMECRRGLAMRILFVRLSVYLSVKRVDCDKTE